MHRPNDKESKENPNASGLKTEQYYPWGGPEWRAASGMRNGVESLNANVKRAQFEDLASAAKRAVQGNSFTYLIGARRSSLGEPPQNDLVLQREAPSQKAHGQEQAQPVDVLAEQRLDPRPGRKHHPAGITRQHHLDTSPARPEQIGAPENIQARLFAFPGTPNTRQQRHVHRIPAKKKGRTNNIRSSQPIL